MSTAACNDETAMNNANVKNKNNPVVQIKTNKGNIMVELYKTDAPISVENFLSYAKENYYDGTVFHRVIDNFMIQGGGFEPGLKEKKTKDPIKNEATNGLKNDRGTLAMARTNEVDSATSQFFINVQDNAFLNHTSESAQGYGYAVFGNVVDGLDVIDAIKKVETTRVSYYSDVPKEDIIIQDVVIIKE